MNIEELYKKFKTQEDCIKYLEKLRWSGKPRCPYCHTFRQTPLPREQRYHCSVCRAAYSVTARTMFHKTKVDLQKWFFAIRNNDLSIRKLAFEIGVTKDTASFMLTRIKIAIKDEPDIIKHFKYEL